LTESGGIRPNHFTPTYQQEQFDFGAFVPIFSTRTSFGTKLRHSARSSWPLRWERYSFVI